jgi:N-methylhydantoinase A
MRYVGQHHEVEVEFGLSALEEGDAGLRRIERAFEARHEELYGFSAPGRPLEVIGLHATALGSREAPPLRRLAGARGTTLKGHRRAWLPIERRTEELEVHDGHGLAPGQVIAGPAIVERATTTVLVPEHFTLSVDGLGSFILRNEEGTR